MASFADTPDNRKGRANIRLDGGAYQYFTFTFEYDSDGNPIDIVIYDSTGTEIPDPAPTLITKIENIIPPYTPPIGAFLWESDGANALMQISDNENLFLGEGAGSTNSTAIFSVGIGHNSLKLANAGNNVAIGRESGSGVTTSSSSVFIGHSAGTLSNSNFTNAVGAFALEESTAIEPSAFGVSAGQYSSGTRPLFFGNRAGRNSTTDYPVYLGYEAGREAGGAYNTGINYRAGFYQEGSYNNFIGRESGYGASGLSIGSFNIGSGYRSLYSIQDGIGNVAIGREAGRNLLSGDYNIFIGYQSGYNETGSNKLYIDNSNTTTPLIYGEFDNDLIRINGELEVRDKTGTFLNVASWDGDKIIDSGVPISSLGQGVGAVDTMNFRESGGNYVYEGLDESGAQVGDPIIFSAGSNVTLTQIGNGISIAASSGSSLWTDGGTFLSSNSHDITVEDINFTYRNTNAITVNGRDSSGWLTDVVIGSGLSLSSGTLSATASSKDFAHIYNSASQSVTSTSFSVLSWGSLIDNQSGFSISGNNLRPPENGYYEISVLVEYNTANDDGANWTLRLEEDGSFRSQVELPQGAAFLNGGNGILTFVEFLTTTSDLTIEASKSSASTTVTITNIRTIIKRL